MRLEAVRRIRCNVHGSIPITILEDKVLAHPYMQRLRRIKQLAFLHYVFPGATHSRFEHSLGVLEMSRALWDKLPQNQGRLKRHLSSYKNFTSEEEKTEGLIGLLGPSFAKVESIFNNPQIEQSFRLASLLHDLGHPAFSHSGELFLPTYEDFNAANTELPSALRTHFLKAAAKAQCTHGPMARIKHEVYSLVLTYEILSELRRTCPDLNHVPIEDVLALMGGPHPGPESELVKTGALGLLRELVAGELDIDRMDYLIRDSHECGVVYGVFDANRIFDALYCYYSPEDNSLHLALSLSGLSAFEDYLRARHSMYLQLYFHKTAVAAEAMLRVLRRDLGALSLPAKAEAYARLDEWSMAQYLHQGLSSLSPEKAAILHQLIDDLIYNRRLWKRVFELSFADEKALTRSEPDPLVRAEAELRAHGIPCIAISSHSALSRFLPQGRSFSSKPKLAVIKKDQVDFPRLYAIETQSRVIAHGDSLSIHRLYTPAQFRDEAARTLRKLNPLS